MAAVLVATGVFLYLRFEAGLDASLDQGLRSRADEVSALARGDGGALDELDRDALAEQDESFAQVLGPAGEVVDATRPLGGQPPLTAVQLARARRAPLLVDRGPLPGLEGDVRVLARPIERGGRTLLVVVGASRDDRDEALASLRALLLTGGPVALALAALAGYGLASAALRPVGSMRREAAEISRLGTGRRLSLPAARDELADLASTLNEMLGRLERSVERERGFVASASHELRTPLALLKGELELALRTGRSAEELRAAIASAAEESDRLIGLAEDLLVLARSDEGLALRPEALAPGDLLQALAKRFALRMAEADRDLFVDPPPATALEADRPLVEQALANLLDNALRHGAGAVTLCATPAQGCLELHVRDEGPGFPPELVESAFERFTRGDRARSRGGTGLGLAIVAAIARAHGGAARARNLAGGGADVWIELPAQASSFTSDTPPGSPATGELWATSSNPARR